MQANVRTKSIAVIFVLLSTVCYAGGTGEEALGSEERPIVWAMARVETEPAFDDRFDAFLTLLYNTTGLYFKSSVHDTNSEILALIDNRAALPDIITFPGFTHLIVMETGEYRALLYANSNESVHPYSQLIVRAGDSIEGFADLAGKTLARPEPASDSGWIVPRIVLETNGANPRRLLADIVDVGSHKAVVGAIYSGAADVGTTYVDAREELVTELPDVYERLSVLTVVEGVSGWFISFHTSVDEEIGERVSEAILKRDADGLSAFFAEVMGWLTIVPFERKYEETFRLILSAVAIDPSDLP